MGKSVLAIDAPSSCEYCPAGRMFGMAGAVECRAGKNIRINRDGQTVPDWCPLEGLEEFLGQPHNAGRWIPCSRKLPEENQNVIVCFAHGTVTELSFYDGKFHGIYSYNAKVIIAWQSLPAPYEGE